MEIRLIIDDRVVHLVRRVFQRRHVVPAAFVGCTLTAGLVYALSPTPPNTFQNGQVLSAAALNENFSQVYQAVSAVETDLAALEQSVLTLSQGLTAAQSDIGQVESEVAVLQSDVDGLGNPLAACQLYFEICQVEGTGSGRFCDALCPSGMHPIGGACSYDDPTAVSWEYPEYPGTANPALGEAMTNFTGWSCGGLDVGETVTYVVCCPE